MSQEFCKIELPNTRVAYDKNYVANVGLATYVFAGYEGLICEVLDFFIENFRYHVAREKPLTSGIICEKLLLILQHPQMQYTCVTKKELEEMHEAFFDLIERRNALIHGRPATAPDGKSPVLNYQAFKSNKCMDFLWLIEDVQRFTLDVSEAQYVVDEIRMRLQKGTPAAARSMDSFPKKPLLHEKVQKIGIAGHS
ncbi:hypothetical protein NC77_02360 [Janthinobacterium lividum]|uniref:hypothetical protein n=1 Tax=Janthinobacterium lividum TaxID=29581 RepID=UPI0005369970|nr:hypothetical protein [Janthinobacterium lividum]KHA80263.1 hypothetical protein NC77_02360 [Janthinobacterium lividum]